jgi:hypothetical protein
MWMGDIGTHAEISRFVIDQARKALPDGAIPATDYAFLELGNFLTDVSQFRDPPAYHRARELARSEAGFGGMVLGSDEWVTDIFGKKSPDPHGALPKMLQLLMSATTHMVFDDDALPTFLGSAIGKVTQSGPSILLEHGIAAQDVDQVLQTSYTQYFPHEHLDSIPLPPGQVASLRARPEFAVGPRNLLDYLERDLLYLSEQLSSLEARWRAAEANGGIRPADRQSNLVKLGHILHAVEDYFFHSNLPEAHVWAAAYAGELQNAPNREPSRADLLSSSLRRTRLGPMSPRLFRLLNRRLRFPVYTAPDKLSTTESEDAAALIFTGGFGQTDVWHTLGGALEALEDQLDRVNQVAPQYDPRKTSLVLFKMLLSRSARAEMVAGKTLEAQRKLHLEQLLGRQYHKKIDEIAQTKLVCDHTAKALLAAFDLDFSMSKKHDGMLAPFPGPGAVLITMMDAMEKEREKSAAAETKLDDEASSIESRSTDNGCSAENIGTHTLMSKDTTSKEPLRAEAVALAKHASASIAVRFLSSVIRPAPVSEGEDWDAALQFFVRGVVLGGWETELLDAVRQDSFQQPDVGRLHNQPQQTVLGPRKDPSRLAARRATYTTAQLEAYYRSLES